MKALITAFALLSFVAASTIPYVAQAQTQQTQTHHTKKVVHKKKTAQNKKHKKSTAKKKKPASPSAKG